MKIIRSEDGLWGYLRDEFLKKTKGSHYSRIESHSTSIGFPDVDYHIGDSSGYIELKHTNGEDIKVRPSQYRWITDRRDAGANNVFILWSWTECGITHLHLLPCDVVNKKMWLQTSPEKWAGRSIHLGTTNSPKFDLLLEVLTECQT